MGTLHKSLVRAEAAALSPQCREASGLSADSLARAESLDKVLQQVSVGARVGGGTAVWQGHYPLVGGGGQESRPGATRPTGRDSRTGSCLKLLSDYRVDVC